jgi:hypothetical protein
MFALWIDNLEGARDCETYSARNDRQTRVDFVAIGQVEGWLRNASLQDTLEADIQIESLKRMNALL